MVPPKPSAALFVVTMMTINEPLTAGFNVPGPLYSSPTVFHRNVGHFVILDYYNET